MASNHQELCTSTDEARQLLLDFETKFIGNPDAFDGWSYNYVQESSWSTPTPRPFHATFYLICNHTNDPVADLKTFFYEVCHFMRRTVHVQVEECSNGDDRASVALIEGDRILASGSVDSQGCTGPHRTGDPNIGFYSELLATTQEGCQFLFHCRMSCTPGYCAYIPHEEMILDVHGGRKIITRTGMGLDEDELDTTTTGRLVSYFLLIDNDGAEMGRCNVLYRGGSDNSVGPTVEKLAIHRDHRGQGLAPLLWYWVLDFIKLGWTMECLNRDVESGRLMIKVTQLINAIVDAKDDGELISDKHFFYNYAGFGTRLLKGGQTSSTRHIGEEAVRYIKLTTPEELKSTQNQKSTDVMVPWKEHPGPRTCDACSNTPGKALRCTQCRRAFYCDQKCQKRDWKRHKLWCGKTKDQVRTKLAEMGIKLN